MRTIHKYNLRVDMRYTLCIHSGFKPLSIDVQNGGIFMWAMIDTSEPLEFIEVDAIGTGQHIPEDVTYIDTVMLNGFVWHFFYKLKEQ